MNTYKSFLGLILFYLASPAFAEDNPCGILHIQIANVTSHSCILIESQIIHGVLKSSAPTAIPSNDSKYFDIEQTLHGPDIVLTYDCGGKQISFLSKQDFCWLSAGKITGHILASGPEIEASYTIQLGSAFWKKPGAINWNLRQGIK
jgi:hypothetical protein